MRQPAINTSWNPQIRGVLTTNTWNPAKVVKINGKYVYVPGYYALSYSPTENSKGTISTVRTPSFTVNVKSKRKMGIRLKPLPFYVKESYMTNLIGNMTTYSNQEFYQSSSYDVLPSYTIPNVGAPSVDALIARAQARNVSDILNQIKDSKANLIQTYAESEQVANMVTNFTSRVVPAIISLRRGNLKGAGEQLGVFVSKRAQTKFARLHRNIKDKNDVDRMLSNGILTVQYGIRPLIQDVIGAAELYAQKLAYESIGECKSKRTTESNQGTGAGTYSSSGAVWSGVSTWDVEVAVKSGYTFTKGSEIIHTVKQLGITNPLLLAWELLPWSFVIDWVYPFGDYLSSLDATLGLDFRDGWESVRVKYKYSLDVTATPRFGNTTYCQSARGQQIFVYDEFKRTVKLNFPSPKFPYFKNPLSWEHALNGLALLVGLKKSVY